MSPVSLDDVVRNLLVYLKGQIPSLQGRSNSEEIQRFANNMIGTIQASISQIEDVGVFDPRSTSEFKTLNQEFEQLKKANVQLEKALFASMSKSEKLQEEIKRACGEIPEQEKSESGVYRQLAAFRQQVAEQTRIATEKQKQIVELQIQVQKQQIKAFGLPVALANAESLGYQQGIHELQSRIDQLQVLLADREKAWAAGNVGVAHLEEELHITQELFSKAESQIQEQQTEYQKIVKELGKERSRPPQGLESDRKRIRELEAMVDSLKQQIKSSGVTEVIKNTQASSGARIAFLEKSLTEAHARINELDQHNSASTDQQLEQAIREKNQLQSRISDLEGTIRLLLSDQMQSVTSDPEAEASPSSHSQNKGEIWQAQEILFFFEAFQEILDVLPNNADYREPRKKIATSLRLLEKNHALESIPTVGTPIQDLLHKAVKIFYSPLLDDNMIIFEASRGFRLRDQILKRALVWIVKSKFQCTACSTPCRPTDIFCPKCGFEVCAPDGTPKRQLQPMPSSIELILPLIDALVAQGAIEKAKGLFLQVDRDHPGNPELQKHRPVFELSQS
ncbi:MAG: nucleotide exchange factor GrpE [Candidatus Ozemobacteraceae bacterium]